MEYLGNNINHYLWHHARNNPEKIAYQMVDTGLNVVKKIGYLELCGRIDQLSQTLLHFELERSVVILYYQDEIEFIISFLACISIGTIPVPVAASKNKNHLINLNNIIDNCKAKAILHDSKSSSKSIFLNILQDSAIPFLSTEDIFFEVENYNRFNYYINEIALIQYTSGSTNLSKGVIISNESLISNLFSISKAFECNRDSVIFSWLPFHHDMGLIGNLLQTIFVGATCVLLSPSSFIHSPKLWLLGISKFRATHSGGPNFSYDLCVEKICDQDKEEMDLSSWLVAFNGAEPVQYETIQKFKSVFDHVKFGQTAFSTCYGLAEATLLVSATPIRDNTVSISVSPESILSGKILIEKNFHTSRILTSSGTIIPEIDLVIFKSDGLVCKELEIGEICLSGQSVSKGYFQNSEEMGFFVIDGKKYLRTGDLGFKYADQLFVNGRIKEMLIVRGVNYYPYDIELLISNHISAVEKNGVAVICIDHLKNDIIVIAEIRRSKVAELDPVSTIFSIESLIRGFFGIEPIDVILVPPFGVPRTTSGKLQRVKCKEIYLDGRFKVLASKSQSFSSNYRLDHEDLLSIVLEKKDTLSIRNYLINVVRAKTGLPISEFSKDDIDLIHLGVDSLKLTSVINKINNELKISVNIAFVLENQSLSQLTSLIENLLWLGSKPTSEEEIII